MIFSNHMTSISWIILHLRHEKKHRECSTISKLKVFLHRSLWYIVLMASTEISQFSKQQNCSMLKPAIHRMFGKHIKCLRPFA